MRFFVSGACVFVVFVVVLIECFHVFVARVFGVALCWCAFLVFACFCCFGLLFCLFVGVAFNVFYCLMLSCVCFVLVVFVLGLGRGIFVFSKQKRGSSHVLCWCSLLVCASFVNCFYMCTCFVCLPLLRIFRYTMFFLSCGVLVPHVVLLLSRVCVLLYVFVVCCVFCWFV